MDLRNLSATPNQLDPVMHRRPSLSSLSSTSGYASSSYGGGGGGGGGTTPGHNSGNGGANSGSNSNNNPGSNGNTTPQLSMQRLSIGSRNNLNLQNSWLQTQSNPTNVAPWVEQQQQQQQLDTSKSSNNNNNTTSTHATSGNSTNLSSGNNSNSGLQSTPNITIKRGTEDGDIDADDEDDDDVIPTAIVIKNIPFAIKKEQLLDVMTKLNLPIPYAFNYHFDNGVFRGLAFANFTSTDETSLVVNQLNGREIGGRKLRVEYKKMLPVQERERIEREKREKRGQLEEQHRSTSNASLASLISAASTTAATKNLSSINGGGIGGGSGGGGNGILSNSNTTERLFINLPSNTGNFLPTPPLELNFNDPETLDIYTQLILYRDDIVKSVFELAISPSSLNLQQRKILSILCNFLSLLELFDNGIIIIRRKPGYIPPQSNLFTSPQQQQQLHTGPSHSSSMMNLNQLGQLSGGVLGLGNSIPGLGNNNNNNNNNGQIPMHPELLRSQSQSAIPLPRLRQQNSTPIQQHFPQYQNQPSGGQNQNQNQSQQQQQQQQQQQSNQPTRSYSQFGLYQQTTGGGNPSGSTGGLSGGNPIAPPVVTPTMISSSAAALLRSSNNRSYVDVRATPPLSANNLYSNQPQQQQSTQLGSSASVTNSPTPQHHHQQHHHQQQQQHLNQPITLPSQQLPPSQPGTPSASNDINSRFQPFGQHSQLAGSFTSLQQTNSTGGGLDDFSDPMISGKFSGLKLGPTSSTGGNNNGGGNNGGNGNGPFDGSSGIWGPK
ncbi:hypothetical protein DFJ63DRAFT_334676 [Scheffersomyces coipomensis]|uniref:uncharacterized protein n=1 Tax=Scheffersomyces coipomensis TaxID=1788519 RepID=UPI00315D110A